MNAKLTDELKVDVASGSDLVPGNEVRIMIGWESLDNTMRLICCQTIQGGEVAAAFKKAPDVAAIPCTFNLEMPVGAAPFKLSSTRG